MDMYLDMHKSISILYMVEAAVNAVLKRTYYFIAAVSEMTTNEDLLMQTVL